MKKLVLTSIIAAAAVLQSFGQGEVVIGNSTTSKIWTNGVASTTTGVGAIMPGSASQGYTFALFAYYTGTLGTSINSGTTVQNTDNSTTPFLSSNWELVGYGVNGGSGRITDANPFETVANIPVSDYATLMMIGWNTSVGGSTISSFDTAYNAALGGTANGLMYGYSADGSILLGNGTVPSNTSAVGTGAGNIPAFTIGLVPVVSTPEPTTMALAGLGGLALLGLRRKK